MTTVTRQIHIARKTRRKVIRPGLLPEPPVREGRTPRISKLMALAIRFDQLLNDGAVANMSDLARLAHVTQPRMTQIMNLLHLAPDIQEDLLDLPPVHSGCDPITERDLRPLTNQVAWGCQRENWRHLRTRPPRSQPKHAL